MTIKSGDILYFIGLGGIGMSALARWCKHLGAVVYGYDAQPTNLTDELIEEGMFLHFEENTSMIPENIDYVIYTPAIPQSNIELKYFRNTKTPIFKRSEFLSLITEQFRTIAIAGTHGKTSITALTAHMLKNAGLNVSAFVGGICRNYNSNLILSENSNYLLIEADEYDRSLLKLNPLIAVISSTDEDHLDIYSDHNDIKSTFFEFGQRIKKNGTLIYNLSVGPFDKLSCEKMSYAVNPDANATASNIQLKNGKYHIDIKVEGLLIPEVRIQVPGMHNIMNTLAASSIGYLTGLSGDDIKSGIESFKGVERRMDYRLESSEIIYIDDYAHHPEEIKFTIETIKELYPEKKITGVFQPHLYSRTNDFANEFANELSKLDEVLIMPIYPAREEPIKGVSSSLIKNKMSNKNCVISNRNEVIQFLKANKPEVLITMGAGDIGTMVKEIETLFLN
ncbi:MAG: UDP-N-acetylmuramate--L-alanine ligase [Lentimicrobiaceae bacterium]|jgi:UDP-N-acetylmuramate--alanine ligase|nr:UDP-N-acetylmuramate--L-alanine ligase [Lentimicrobiaceae bacterium]MCP4909320.1 UDP-N-acetylmuramate--L-alanine ligase [Bacteroidota bacterium]MBT3454974.1 UDP-N-acetylmuramate--L-alanine ligase [Lentimicrobiaceae bacterium]MBT3818400.1 UDP-N-acetylmuramate--L-alanine ligase [Lentimicrobiaceae bacterium]MBT4060768.1 UDP-N-acetylmuramate--L-alanine ligase [Lentimicrobiaceae bacterium]